METTVKEMSLADSLSPMQKLFVERLLAGMPAGRAYEAAGYAARGSSADSCASKLLRNDKVHAYVQQLRDEMQERAIAKGQELQEILTKIVRGEEAEPLLAQTTGTLINAKPKLDTRIRAAELLAKLQGLFNQDSGNPGQLDAIARALEAVDKKQLN